MTHPPARTRRLFFALWPDEDSRARLCVAIRELLPQGARPVPRANLHLTLAFLGSVADERIGAVDAMATQVCSRLTAQPLQIELTQLAHWREPQILVALPQRQPPTLEALAATLSQALLQKGFTPDLKRFRAHVTVARKVTRPPKTPALPPVSWCFSEYALIESRGGVNGPVYSVLQSYPLVKTQKVRE
jgi:RNA 2',3'-cyclic 3'-phosphodiesterase